MNQQMMTTNPIKAWLAEFLLLRGLIKPHAKPLYTYQVTEEEYSALRQLLRDNFKQYLKHPTHKNSFAACFCLFVSEQYRRNYNGTWSWQCAEDELGIVGITPGQHGSLSAQGLEYWQRPVRQRETGRDWLGSLFAEGGIPWPLVQSETHGFGRAIRRGIKNYYRRAGNFRSTADLLAEAVDVLPQSFRNLETRQLLAGIVDQLMYLAEQYPLNEQQDPAAYLDNVLPDWQSIFPLPIDEANARSLINEWLRDAGNERQGRKKAMEQARAFTSEHFLLGQLPDWQIQTELHLPAEHTIKIDRSQLSNTRLEVVYYEGDKLLAHGPALYGQLMDEGIRIRFTTTQIALLRRNLGEPVILRILDNGRTIHQFHFDGSSVDSKESPLTFDINGGRWQLVSASSCSLQSSPVRVRLPKEFVIETDLSKCQSLVTDSDGGYWIETTSDLKVRNEKEQWHISVGQPENQQPAPLLTGATCLFACSPSVVYMGWPKLAWIDGAMSLPPGWKEYANGHFMQGTTRADLAGYVRYGLSNDAGNAVLQRRFGVLPKEFNLSMSPATANKPATLQLKGCSKLSTHIVSNTLKVTSLQNEQGVTYQLQPIGEIPPADVILEISSSGFSPVQLRLPFPFQGVRLIAPDGQPCKKNELILNELIGYRLALSSGYENTRRFVIALDLICNSTPKPQRTFEMRVGNTPVELDLYSYRDAIIQMLSAVKEQDAFVKFTVSTDRVLLGLNICRYNAELRNNKDDNQSLVLTGSSVLADGCKPLAMLLSDPRQQPLALQERETQGIGLGIFDLPLAMQKKGSWLIYPERGSRVSFRPCLHIPSGEKPELPVEINSLHLAAEVFHPSKNPDVIKQQIEKMANDFDHSGWQYLLDLKQRFEHLPLSTFESWIELSRNDEALALAVFRLEMDIDFCTRVRDELAIIWEAVPMAVWVSAYRIFVEALTLRGLPDVFIRNFEDSRAAVLRFVVPGFDHLDGYLQTGNTKNLKVPPIEDVLTIWAMQLRQQHDSDREWPTQLSDQLTNWINTTELPVFIKNIAPVGYTRSVTYLPVFMAHVTAGKAKLSDLSSTAAFRNNAIRQLSDFDRQQWYLPVHAVLVCYLLSSDQGN